MKEHNYFIRTRDNIYQGRDDFIVLKDQELYIKHFQDHIVKVADTIEELCDEFVCHKETCKDLLVAKSYQRQFNEDLYGAIWTDKGLIYVAKMNEQGELELL